MERGVTHLLEGGGNPLLLSFSCSHGGKEQGELAASLIFRLSADEEILPWRDVLLVCWKAGEAPFFALFFVYPWGKRGIAMPSSSLSAKAFP